MWLKYSLSKLAQDDDYRGAHEAPDRSNGAPMWNISGVYPEDFYSPEGLRYYGDGSAFDSQSYYAICHVRNRPNRVVKVYRAIPDINFEITQKLKYLGNAIWYIKTHSFPPHGDDFFRDIWVKHNFNNEAFITDVEQQYEEVKIQLQKPLTIQPGDWVTIARGYAVEHGQGNLNKKYKIISKSVKASDLYTDGNSLNEWGYDPS